MGFLHPRPLQYPRAGGALRLLAQAEPLGGRARDAIVVVGLSRKGWGPFPLPMDLKAIGAPGEQLLVSLDLLIPAPASGTGDQETRAVRLPGESEFIVHLELPAATPPGSTLGVQLLVIVPGRNAVHLATSNALWCTVGSAQP